MSGLLQNARKFFQGLAPAPAARSQSFSVACPEGHRLTGVRTEGYQALRCPTCGEGIFVLPRSPLPEPAAPASTAPARHRAPAPFVDDDPVALSDPTPVLDRDDRRGTDAGAESEELAAVEWVDEPVAPGVGPEDFAREEMEAQTRPPAADRAETVEAAGRATRRPRPRPRPNDLPAPPPAPVTPRVPAGERLRRHRNPFIFLTVGLVVVGTVAFRVWRSRVADLPRVAEAGRVEGLAALDAGKFDRAHQLLSEAKRAVDALGDAYQGAGAIRQGADEAEIIARLAPGTLEDVLDEAARADPAAWSRRFDTLYKGRTVILDTQIVSVPDGQGNGHFELDYRIFREGEGGQPSSVGGADTTGFRLFELTRPKVGDRVTFGARLRSFRFDLARETWFAEFEPDSGVIMTHTGALEALGWPAAGEPAGEALP